MDSAAQWNLIRFDPTRVDPKKGHLESIFLKFNDPEAPRALWVKVTVFSPTERTSGGPLHPRGHAVAEVWAIAFDHTVVSAEQPVPADIADCAVDSYRQPRPNSQVATSAHVAVKQTVAIEDAQLSRFGDGESAVPFQVHVADVRYDGERLSGRVEHGGACITFDLKLLTRDPTPLVHLPLARLYEGKFPKTKLVSPILDARAEGWIEIQAENSGNRRWEVHAWPAMQGHNWGTGHADLYAWAHINCWNEAVGSDVVFEGFSGKVRLGDRKLFGRRLYTPMLSLAALKVGSTRYVPSSLRSFFQVSGEIQGLRRWVFAGTLDQQVRIEGSIALVPEDTVGLYYPNPNGEMTYCLNSKIALASLRIERPGQPTLVLTSRAAALEIATHDGGHGIRMYV